jgi:hypothetical protein
MCTAPDDTVALGLRRVLVRCCVLGFSGEEHGPGQPGVSDAVAAAVRDLADEAVIFEAAQVVSGLSGCDRPGRAAEVAGERGAGRRW